MPLSTAQKSQLQTDVQTLNDAVAALVVDPVPDPKDQQITDLTAQVAALSGKIAAAKQAVDDADAADAIEDTARIAVHSALA